MGTTTRSGLRRMCCPPCFGFGSKSEGTTARRIDGAGWGLFFLWVGVALLLDVGWGIGLLGVGILTLAMQVVRRASTGRSSKGGKSLTGTRASSNRRGCFPSELRRSFLVAPPSSLGHSLDPASRHR